MQHTLTPTFTTIPYLAKEWVISIQFGLHCSPCNKSGLEVDSLRLQNTNSFRLTRYRLFKSFRIVAQSLSTCIGLAASVTTDLTPYNVGIA